MTEKRFRDAELWLASGRPESRPAPGRVKNRRYRSQLLLGSLAVGCNPYSTQIGLKKIVVEKSDISDRL